MTAGRWSILTGTVVLFMGCASSQLTLGLDIYEEDPSYVVPLAPARIAGIYQGLDRVELEADSLAQARKELADQLFDTYEGIFALSVKATDVEYEEKKKKEYEEKKKKELDPLREWRNVYKRTIETKAKKITALAKQARSDLERYVISLRDGEAPNRGTGAQASQLSALETVRKASLALVELGGPLETPFEGWVQQWPTVARSIEQENLKRLFNDGKKHPELGAFRSSVAKLSQKIEELRADGRRIPEEVSTKLKEAAQIDIAEPGAFKKSIDAVAKAATAVPTSVGLSDRGTVAITELATSTTLLYSQIDRLQDPADPVWRVVSAPENESKWNTQFSETFFYAEGNSSVVVVRDTPMSFRVQRGNNNPTALVQNQLQISRAIGSAAIDIAGAFVGVPLPQLHGSDQAGGQTEDSGTTGAETLARREAKLQKEAAFRAQAVTNLRRDLISLRDALKETDPKKDPAGMKALLSRFESILNAHDPVFKSTQ